MTAAVLAAAALAHGGRRVTARVIRRLADFGRRTFSRGADHRVWLGCVEYGHRFYVFAEDLVLVLPPRTGRPGVLTGQIPGHRAAATDTGLRPNLDGPGEEGGAS
jgi:hypothetical protein